MATKLTQYSATPNSITVRVSGWPSGTGYIRFYIGTSTSNMPYCGYEEVVGRTSCTFTFDIVPYSQNDSTRGDPLEPDTAYYVKISPRAATSGQEAMESATTVLMYTEPEAPAGRPSNWSWSSTVSKGAEMQYTKSGNTITCKPLTASEWNRFVDRVVEFAEYCGMSIPSNYGDSWYVTKGARMEVTEVNYMRELISYLPITVSLPSAAKAGGKITAAYINGLKNSLNSIE